MKKREFTEIDVVEKRLQDLRQQAQSHHQASTIHRIQQNKVSQFIDFRGSRHKKAFHVPASLGMRKLLELMNAQLPNGFTVSYGFGRTTNQLTDVCFDRLTLFYHELVLPKTDDFEAKRTAIEKGLSDAFASEKQREDDTTVTYLLCLDNGVFADTMEDAVSSIFHRFEPHINQYLQQLQIEDYQMNFILDTAY